mmetsp:Transcript_12599/g.22868  ORF Transcript_12599/g.22868 Transcript_12599/m.22868 type:complete len:377 (+) Transcript_12599:122-1252(+)|eukprot:CAMPEP_0197529020 /NCGR_PEP_ID=MMETSP1318-20131121/27049_1 /TAXON_ID=552666 /ORGANISM="Partenskyella glossopodia, Strain RCC365" /LENGTH=376 /DNA_ID=CAMNT_0043084337 /DNA_START=82 /DNA_END=1212 /DNA_ORIENTATION=-
MKFGEILLENSEDGWVYVNYRNLKKIIRYVSSEQSQAVSDDEHTPSLWFKNALMADITDVNKFFEAKKAAIERENEKNGLRMFEKLKKLHKYAVINYLAVLKIVKKHDKHFPAIREKVLDVLTKLPLYQAVKSPSLFEGIEKVDAPKGIPDCPICLDPCITPVTLECGHNFCWLCMWKSDIKNLVCCPLCRKTQSLNPMEMDINDILGGFSKKYFPREIERKDDPVKQRSRNPMNVIKVTASALPLILNEEYTAKCGPCNVRSPSEDKPLCEQFDKSVRLDTNSNSNLDLHRNSIFIQKSASPSAAWENHAPAAAADANDQGLVVGSIACLRKELHRDLNQTPISRNPTKHDREFFTPIELGQRAEEDECIFDLEL